MFVAENIPVEHRSVISGARGAAGWDAPELRRREKTKTPKEVCRSLQVLGFFPTLGVGLFDFKLNS